MTKDNSERAGGLVETYRRSLDNAAKRNAALESERDELRSEVEALEAREAKLRKALEFYASKSSWGIYRVTQTLGFQRHFTKATDDKGDIARAALEPSHEGDGVVPSRKHAQGSPG